MQLREGPDVSTLGVVEPPAPKTPLPPSHRRPAASTLVVVPPTPEGRSHHPLSISTSPLPHSGVASPVDVPPNVDPDSLELQNKRRSMFRSPGLASSPDLATLLRKAKENGGIVSGSGAAATGASQRHQQEEGGLAPGEASGAGFLSPSHNSPRLRGSSSTSSFSMVSGSTAPRKEGGSDPSTLLSANRGTNVGASPAGPKPEWSLTSPRARSGSKVCVKLSRIEFFFFLFGLCS